MHIGLENRSNLKLKQIAWRRVFVVGNCFIIYSRCA